jgi:uncharacterized protein (DUF983 family)
MTSRQAPSPLAAARACVCPRCGRGRLFSGYLKVVETCGVCGLKLAANDSGDGPAVFLIFILGFVLTPPILWLSMRVEWPLWLHAVVWSVVVLGATVGLLRPAKAYTVALQYKHHPDSFGDNQNH